MKFLINKAYAAYILGIQLIVLIFIIFAIICACNAYGDTWTIDGGFKVIYDDYHDCMINNLGTGTTDICDDETQVKYRNK